MASVIKSRPLPPQFAGRLDLAWGIEAADSLDSTFQHDAAAKVIRGVKLIGNQARNKGRVFPQDVLRAAIPKLNGAKAYWGHSREAVRPNDEALGWFENAREISGKPGVYGDFHYLQHAKYTPNLLEIIERNPSQMGMSIDYLFVEVDPAGKVIDRVRAATYSGPRSVKEIVSVHSVDVVADPSATKSFQESYMADEDTGREAEPMESIDHARMHCHTMVKEHVDGMEDPKEVRKLAGRIESILKESKGGAGGKGESGEEKKKEKNMEPMPEQEAAKRIKELEAKLDLQQAQEATKIAAALTAHEKAKVDAEALRGKAIQAAQEAAGIKTRDAWISDYWIGQLVKLPEAEWAPAIADRIATVGVRPGAISHSRESFTMPGGGGGNPPPKKDEAPKDETREEATRRRKQMADDLYKQAVGRA